MDASLANELPTTAPTDPGKGGGSLLAGRAAG